MTSFQFANLLFFDQKQIQNLIRLVRNVVGAERHDLVVEFPVGADAEGGQGAGLCQPLHHHEEQGVIVPLTVQAFYC